MSKKKIFGIVSLTVILGASSLLGFSKTTPIERVEAAAGAQTWSIVGTIGGTNWDKDFDLVYNSSTTRYEYTMVLNAGENFKIRLDHKWDFAVGGNNGNGELASPYLTYGNDNFIVKTTNNYCIWVKEGLQGYKDKSWGYGLDIVTTTEHTVTHYKKDGTVASTGTVLDGAVYSPLFFEEEGYRLDGWYTEPELTNKFEKGTAIKEDLNLYPKYIEAADYEIYLWDPDGVLGNTVNVYTWCDAFDGHTNNTWPGTQVTTGSGGLLYLTIDASKCFDRLIINNGTAQTIDIPLSFETKVYELKTEKDGEKYTGNILSFDVDFLVDYLMRKDTKDQCDSKFESARKVFLSLPSADQETFKTSDDTTIADARTRYEAWARHLGQNPYAASSASRGFLTPIAGMNNSVTIFALIALASIGLLMIAFTIKKIRKER